MAQSSTTAATAKHNGFTLKFEEMNNNPKSTNKSSLGSSSLPSPSSSSSSSPRRTAIGKPSLRLSIPTIEQIADSSKSQPKLNQMTDPGNKKIDSFVKRMIDNCNHSGQLPSNVECITNGDSQSNSENAAEICDTNRVKSVIEKLDKNKRMSSNGGDGSGNNSVNGKSPTTEAVPVPATGDDEERTIKLSVDDLTASTLNECCSVEQNNNNNNGNADNDDDAIVPADECSQLENFPSYSKFENEFKKRINELNSSRSDTQTHAHGTAFYVSFTFSLVPHWFGVSNPGPFCYSYATQITYQYLHK